MDSICINYIAYRSHLIKLGRGGRPKLEWNEKRGECIAVGPLSAHFDFSPLLEVCASLGVNMYICPKLYNHGCQEELDLVIPELSVSPILFYFLL